MSMAENQLPYGLRDVKLTPIENDGTYGTMVDLPASRTLTWNETVDTEELRGDDELQAERESAAVIEWDLEQGGISPDAYAVLAGGTVTEEGTGPTASRTYSKVGADRRPYFRIDGQAINDNGGDTHIVIFRAKATGNIGGSFTEGSFQLTSASGRGYSDPNNGGQLYDIVGNNSETPIAQPS